MRSRGAESLATAVRTHVAKKMNDVAGNQPTIGVVRRGGEDFEVEVVESRLTWAAEELVLTQQFLTQVMAQPLREDDSVLLQPLANGDWAATGVISDETPTGGVGEPGPPGPEGPPGPAGPEGPIGPSGPTGSAEEWHAGAGVPSGALGVTGHWYLNTGNGDVYEKTAPGTWTLRANIKGPTGAPGADGATGPTGATGSDGPAGPTGPPGTPGEKWFTGSGAPAGATGAVDDWYLDSASGDYYEKTGASTWTLRGNLKGPSGAGIPQVTLRAAGSGAAIAPNSGITADVTGCSLNFTQAGTYMVRGWIDIRTAVALGGGNYGTAQYVVAGTGVTIQQQGQVMQLNVVTDRLRLPVDATVVVPSPVPGGASIKMVCANASTTNGAVAFEPTGSYIEATIINGVGATGPTGAAGVVSPGTWATVPGGSNWVTNDASTIPRYRKDSSGTVFLEGAVRNVAGFSFAGTNYNCIIMPAGFRPQQTMVIHAVLVDPTNGPRPVCLQLNTDGNGYLLSLGPASVGIGGGIASVVYLSGISYLAA